MLKHLFTKAPLIAVLGVSIFFTIVASAGLGLDWPALAAIALAIFVTGQSWSYWALWKRGMRTERHLRHIRFVADRFQAMLSSLPGGYCLFTPQGLLREEKGVSARLSTKKITHMDDLILSIKEGPDLLEAFRKLQMTGQFFAMPVNSVEGEKTLQVKGQRFRIGKDGPHADILWFCDQDDLIQEAFGGSSAKLTVVKEPVAEKAVEEGGGKTESFKKAPEELIPEVTSIDQDTCFDILPFPVWMRGPDMAIKMCNLAYAKALESSREEVLAEQKELMQTSSKGGKTLAQESIKSGQAGTARDHAVVNGSRRLLQIVERPYPAHTDPKQDQKYAMIGFATDVTSEEEKETELERHLVSHHEVMEHLGTAIGIFGPDTKLEFYNRAYQRLWEADEGFLDSKPTFSDLMEDMRTRRKIPEQADFQKYKKEYLKLFTSLLEPREDVLYLPDGTSLRNVIAPHPLGGLMFVYENVTQQLALETSYNTLMAVQRETLDNLSEGIAVFGPDGKLRLSNPALARSWNISDEFLEGEPHVGDLIEHVKDYLDVPDDAWTVKKERMVSYALDRSPRSGRIERKDNVVMEYATVPLPDGSVLNSFLNVTDSVHVEQALRASNAALAAADRLKSDFVANVSYQLRTPLNTIVGFAEILSEQYFGSLNDRQSEYTNTIKAESEKLSRLINDVLDLATIEAGRMTLTRTQVDVANLLNEAKQMTAEWGRQQSLEILIDCPSNIGAFAVDEHRMKQVLFNLISNAIKYTPAGGHIAIAAWEQDSWVVISVLDTGVGIPEEDRDRVFGKFEKTNSHLRQAGAGLGLSLVKSFVELHGGRVEIFSDKEDGTRISCFLPKQTPVQQDAAD